MQSRLGHSCDRASQMQLRQRTGWGPLSSRRSHRTHRSAVSCQAVEPSFHLRFHQPQCTPLFLGPKFIR